MSYIWILLLIGVLVFFKHVKSILLKPVLLEKGLLNDSLCYKSCEHKTLYYRQCVNATM